MRLSAVPDDAVTDGPPDLPPDRHATALSRGLVIAFVLVLCFIGWLGVVGIGDAAGQGLLGLFDPAAGGCGGG